MGPEPPVFLKATALTNIFATQVVLSWEACSVQIFTLECSVSTEFERLNNHFSSFSLFGGYLVNHESCRAPGVRLGAFERGQPGLFSQKKNFEIGYRGQISQGLE